MTTFHIEYALKPVLFDAKTAHSREWITYLDDGTVVIAHPILKELGAGASLHIPVMRQFSCIRATFDDLNKTLSRFSNSPLMDGANTLRQLYEKELNKYETLVIEAEGRGAWEPDYGTYVFDHRIESLYLIAPEFWHRLSLVTSNSKLATDPENRLSWQEIRRKLENTVVGFAGLSVGGNLLEGWLREARPRQVKIADHDWLELPNFNRCERASLRHLVSSKAHRFDLRNSYEVPRVLKADYIAYENNLVDPYLNLHIYKEQLSEKNMERFLVGDNDKEPRLDVLVEEIDDLDVKIALRQAARKHNIDVLMLTDFGHRTQVMWNPFSVSKSAKLGTACTDQQLLEALAETKTGDRKKVFDFIEHMCRFDFAGDPFEKYVNGDGEHPTSSLPQSGATTMIAGGIGGKEIMLQVLGHERETSTGGMIYDFLNRQTWRS